MIRRVILPVWVLAILLSGCKGEARGAARPGDYRGDVLVAPLAEPDFTLTATDGRPYHFKQETDGAVALLFFGYTHCPDVCPATVGTLGVAMQDYGSGARSVFVTVDPERDTPTWLQQYDQYLPSGFTTLTGTADEIRATADAWGVKYARVETGDPTAYSMSHTADVYLVDSDGELRADLPFGTDAPTIAAVMRLVASTTPAPGTSAGASPPASASGGASALVLEPEIISSSVWAGDPVPIILSITGPGGRVDDTSAQVTVQLESADGAAVGPAVTAVAVQPPGVADVSFVATLDIPSPGAWRFGITALTGALPLSGSTGLVTALDQGATPALGGAAPAIHTTTLADVGGSMLAVTTDPIPDRRLYTTSTSDALAGHDPFVLVLDSSRFRVTSACGRALIMAKYLVDRWPDVTFIHQEPFQYSIVTDTAVLDGTLSDPTLTDVASGMGLGSGPWDAVSMPWIFIVDGNGIVRAKYQGVVGTDDVDVIVSLIEQGG